MNKPQLLFEAMLKYCAFPLFFLSISTANAWANTVTFSGLRGNDQGVIGYNAVDPSLTAPGAASYAALGVQSIYTSLTSPDAFDYTNGGDLGFAENLPTHPFGATAASPHGLEAYGLSGDLHISSLGFSLDYTNSADLFFIDALHEQRIYRGGSWKIFEETGPGTYAEVGSYSNMVASFIIDYSKGIMSGTFSGTKDSGNAAFPEIFNLAAFDPLDNSGSTASGQYGQFSTNVSFTVAPVPLPAAVWLFGSGLFGLIGFARGKV